MKLPYRTNDPRLDYEKLMGDNHLIVDCHPGPAHAFQRAHLVDVRLNPKGWFRLNFRTHTVTVSDENAKAVFDDVLAGKLSVLSMVNAGNGGHIRVVKAIQVHMKEPVRAESAPQPSPATETSPSQPETEPTYEEILAKPRTPSTKLVT